MSGGTTLVSDGSVQHVQRLTMHDWGGLGCVLPIDYSAKALSGREAEGRLMGEDYRCSTSFGVGGVCCVLSVQGR